MHNDIVFEQIKQGNEHALEKFTKENYLSFCSVADRFVGNIDEAEDIVQDVLIRLWENRHRYPEIVCLKSFVYTMIRNHALNAIRQRKRSEAQLRNKPIEEEPGFLNIIIEEESSRLLLQAINTLPEQSSRIIRMSLEGLKNGEIAEQLNISENTVKVLKYRSLKKLRILLRHRIFNLLTLFI